MWRKRLWLRRHRRNLVAWGGTGFFLFLTFTFNPYLPFQLFQQPSTQYFTFHTWVYPYGSDGFAFGPTQNVSVVGTFTITSPNPVGVSAENPINVSLQVVLSGYSPPSGSYELPSTAAMYFGFGQTVNPAHPDKFSKVGDTRFNMTTINAGETWVGSTEAVFTTEGEPVGFVFIMPLASIGIAKDAVGPVFPTGIQVQPASALDTYDTGRLVSSMTFLIVALMILELRRK